MRISKIHIESFGKVKDKIYTLDPGFNVFYGPNESGKTTTMEFIRSTIVPTSKRAVYPERSKKDCGSITYSEAGAERTIILEGREQKGDIPASTENLDPEVYRSLFAMGPEGLNDHESVSSGELRSKFLTIPGGESVPSVLDSLQKEADSHLGKTNASNSKLNDIRSKEEQVSSEIAELKAKTETYQILVEEHDALKKELDEIIRANNQADEVNQRSARIESLKPSYLRFQELKEERKKLGNGQTVSPDIIRTHDQLKQDADQKKAAYEAMEKSRISIESKIPAGRTEEIRRRIPDIRSLSDDEPCYESMRSLPTSTGDSSFGSKIIFIILGSLLIVAAGLAPLDLKIRMALCAAGAAIAVIPIVVSKMKAPAGNHRDESWMQDYESKVRSLSESLGITHTTVHGDLVRLNDLIPAVGQSDTITSDCNKLKMEWMMAENKLLGFLAQYNGENGYNQAVRNTEDLRVLDSNLKTLRDSLETSGIDPDSPFPETEHVETDKQRQSEIASQIGSLEVRMKECLDTKRLDSLINERYMLDAEKEKVLRSSAVIMLSQRILQDACAEMYESVHPDVIKRADEYLSQMTSGIYRFDVDPRRTELSIVSEEGPKNLKQCSSGLRAQVLLSIKLAIAREMGSGEVPVILDDVLLPFDSERKEGACKAISSLSNEMQVIMFTCDDDVAEIAEKLGVRVTQMA